MGFKLKVMRYLQKPKLHGMKDQQLVSLRYFIFLYLNDVIHLKNVLAFLKTNFKLIDFLKLNSFVHCFGGRGKANDYLISDCCSIKYPADHTNQLWWNRD